MSGSTETKQAIHAFLTADTTLTAMLHEATGIYHRSAPQDAVFPFVVYFKSAGSPEFSFADHYEEELWTIKGVDRGDSGFKATQIADRIETIMHDADLNISGQATLYCRREQDVDYAESEPGHTIQHIGAIFKLYRIAT